MRRALLLLVVSGAAACKSADDAPPPPPVVATSPPREEPVAVAPTASAPAPEDGLAACCDELRHNANTGPSDRRAAFGRAAAACSDAMGHGAGRDALAPIRKDLKAFGFPAACR